MEDAMADDTMTAAARDVLAERRIPVLDVAAGDAVLIPAGVGHCRVDDAPGLSVVAAYPPGCRPDMCRQGEGDPAGIRKRIADVGVPLRDPILGSAAGAPVRWQEARR